ncbi:hypothetical protein [Sedimenticola selenatireducens]|uniref:Uncharacterized protein n=1 Tax=Sedimenticola selenatireducens TaxID=191960 RepID=A0A557SCL1_9GAMM|nr:hypothetical protein [Sedimenticola selenatireducens]TVO75133.1 hypothetical protein FHP88_08965 [Sedimenticola selenatireducens]TVT67012.1 MAG: hypothetical protein FHK78_01390 [Sedimenticola selenatireducens]
MSDGVFNIAKGSVVEKIRDASTNVLLLLLKANEAETALVDHDNVSVLLGAAGNTEADFTNYARKTGLTGTITVDDSNDRVDVDLPDQAFISAGGALNNTLTKAVVAYEESATDTGRVPLTHHDFAATTDGSDLTLQVNAAGFYRAA